MQMFITIVGGIVTVAVAIGMASVVAYVSARGVYEVVGRIARLTWSKQVTREELLRIADTVITERISDGGPAFHPVSRFTQQHYEWLHEITGKPFPANYTPIKAATRQEQQDER